MKHVVRYKLAYDHVVCVGIDAVSSEAAIGRAQALFEAGTLWDDTPDVPLLQDDYEEQDDNVLEFEVLESSRESYPAPDASVLHLRRERALAKVARLFIQAYQAGEENGGIDWSDLDLAYEVALQAGLAQPVSAGS